MDRNDISSKNVDGALMSMIQDLQNSGHTNDILSIDPDSFDDLSKINAFIDTT